MQPESLKIRLVAVFLVAFVCLNAGGFVCVAYCQSSMRSLAAAANHFPLQKKADHCDPSKSENGSREASDSVGTDKIECCRMAFNFVGGPLEKRTFSGETAAAPVAIEIDWTPPALSAGLRQNPPPAYRGPPLDRRGERLKHCVIRI